MPPPDRRSRLIDAAADLAQPLTEAQADQLLAYIDLLQRWNGTYNLTAIRDPEHMLVQHVLDCLAMIGPLRRHLNAAPTARLLDVGSGGGLPGIIIAILCPEIDVTCVDTVGKKAAFIQQAAGSLRLPNLHSRHARVEQMTSEPFDVVTSRAFASLADFVTLTRQHLAAGGVWLAMKGKDPADERAQLPADVNVFHVEQLAVPGLAAERCLVWMRPKPSL
ncbi:MAG: 16S rRNA (guanine(527)-N(7))-methyltransferase RsmG [Burkholderiales bacterium]